MQNQLVLLGGGVDARDAIAHDHPSDDLLSEEVSDLDDGVLLAGDHVDGKVSVDGSHLVQVALGHADDHVVDVRADGTDGGELLANAEPLLHTQLVLADHLKVELLLELSGQHTAWALDANLTVLDGDLNCDEEKRSLVFRYRKNVK